jgi:hypothetical protein
MIFKAMKESILLFALFSAATVFSNEVSQDIKHSQNKSSISFDAGAALRVRQEIMGNVPALPGGFLGKPGVIRSKTKNQLRVRPSLWFEIKEAEKWRIYARVTDEMRACTVQKSHLNSFPGELLLDNFYFEGVDFFDGFLDVKIGRQDIYRLYGLDHIFVDGTPGDGSRTMFSDMAAIKLKFTEKTKLDLFALYNKDQEEIRWGTRKSRGISKTGFGAGDNDMDDWGFGGVFSTVMDEIDFNLFYIQKNTASFKRSGVKIPRRQVNLFGVKVVPHFTDELSMPLEAMAQVGKTGSGEALAAWAGYAGFDWRSKNAILGDEIKPFWNGGVLLLSGDKDTSSEYGGKSAWDPMWYRGVDDSEMFLYGSLYGCGWWSNMINVKTTLGLDFGKMHCAKVTLGPMFTETRDGIGGGDGAFKGFLTQLRYDFPLLLNGKNERGVEIFGHVLAEFFNPGDYFATDKPAYFVRWQIDVRF